MKIHAYKYQGAGNDFVILDNRNGEYEFLTNEHGNEQGKDKGHGCAERNVLENAGSTDIDAVEIFK